MVTTVSSLVVRALYTFVHLIVASDVLAINAKTVTADVGAVVMTTNDQLRVRRRTKSIVGCHYVD